MGEMIAVHPPTHGTSLPAATLTAQPVRWSSIGKIVALIVSTCLCYAPSLGGGFLWDDDLWIAHNPLVQSIDGLRRIWLTTEPYDFFPLTSTSFWLEWPLWGTDPFGYRVTNLLLHLASTFLLWRVLTRLRVPGAWFGALLFAVHPVNVASVAWITERKNTLSMLFALAALLCWTESEERPPGTRSRGRWLAAAIVAFALAALSKSSVVMVPCVLLVLVWWRRGKIRWPDLGRTLPFFAVSLVAGLLTIWFQFHRSMNPDWQREAGSAWVRPAIAGRAMAFYLGKTLLPARLSMIYPHWQMSGRSVADWLPLAGMAALFAVAWQGRERWGRGPLAALGSFAWLVLPVSGFVPMAFSQYSYVSDHLVYLPMLALLVGIAAALTIRSERGGASHRAAVLGLMTMLAVLCMVGSFRRADEFGSSRRLWESTIAMNPGCAMAYNNLGIAVEDAGHLREAEAAFRRALQLQRAQPQALTNLAGVLQHEHRWPEAAAAYVTTIRRSHNAKDYNNYGVVLLQLDQPEAAQAQFREAARREPAMLSPRFNLYKVAIARGDEQAAGEDLRSCLRIDPDDVPSLLGLATLEIKAGPSAAGAETVALAEKANRLTQGDDPVALGTLSWAYRMVGRRGEAIALGEQAHAAAIRNRQPELASEISRYLGELHAGP